jgi:hypothetical protein
MTPLSYAARRVSGVCGALLLAAAAVGLTEAGPAAAHTPTWSAGCTSTGTVLHVHLSAYPAGSTVTVTTDGTTTGPVTFGPAPYTFGESVPGTAAHTFALDVLSGDRKHRFDVHDTKAVPACSTTSPTPSTSTSSSSVASSTAPPSSQPDGSPTTSATSTQSPSPSTPETSTTSAPPSSSSAPASPPSRSSTSAGPARSVTTSSTPVRPAAVTTSVLAATGAQTYSLTLKAIVLILAGLGLLAAALFPGSKR